MSSTACKHEVWRCSREINSKTLQVFVIYIQGGPIVSRLFQGKFPWDNIQFPYGIADLGLVALPISPECVGRFGRVSTRCKADQCC